MNAKELDTQLWTHDIDRRGYDEAASVAKLGDELKVAMLARWPGSKARVELGNDSSGVIIVASTPEESNKLTMEAHQVRDQGIRDRKWLVRK